MTDEQKADLAVLAPFSVIAGELFSQNFNAGDCLLVMGSGMTSIFSEGRHLKLRAGDFFALRRLSARLGDAVQPVEEATRSLIVRLGALEENTQEADAQELAREAIRLIETLSARLEAA